MLGVTVHLLIQAFEQVQYMYKIIHALRLCKTRMSTRKETSPPFFSFKENASQTEEKC